jgi:hypothetical protein
LGIRQPALSLLRRAADLQADTGGAPAGRHVPIAVETDFEQFIAGRRALLDECLIVVEAFKSFRGAQPPRKLRWTNAGC